MPDRSAITWDPDATRTLGDGVDGPAADAPPLLAGRYALGALIGKGGSGQVHEAHDTLTGATVAVKLVRAMSPGDRRQLRRELTALRLLDLPGVVRLLDDGEDRGQVFLVMELLPGGTLRRLAGAWPAPEAAARRLVETLARLHRAGVIHRDLKPGNILLDAAGRPVVTDFGLAQGRAVETRSGLLEGTPRYMPPEQRAGLACDERSDLYALGAVLWELARDEAFVPEPDARPPLPDAVPAALRAMIDRMLAPEPADRPASAEEVLEALGGGDPVLGPLPALADPVPREALAALFDEAVPTFHHLAEDAADLLLARTGGEPSAVRAALGAWIRAGRAHWVDDRLHLDRTALAALSWEEDPDGRDLAARILAAEEGLAARALAVSDAAWNAGRPTRALAVLEQVLSVTEAPTEARALRHRLAARALSLNAPEAVRRALYQAFRAEDGPLTRLLQGARLCGTQEMQRAADALAAVPALPPELELWRVAWLSHALARLDRSAQDALLTRVEGWCADDPLRRARWLGWRGMARYQAGRYAEALADHEASAAALEALPVERLTALLNGAAAALEVGAPERAEALAAQAAALGRVLRHPVAECGATLLVASARYRRGRSVPAGRVEAAARASPAFEAHFALVEAASAWREGRDAVPLALRAARSYGALGHRARGLALGLAAAAGAAVDPEEVARAAREAGHPTLALQAAALGAPGAELPIEAWAAGWHLGDPRARADVLSLEECRERLGR